MRCALSKTRESSFTAFSTTALPSIRNLDNSLNKPYKVHVSRHPTGVAHACACDRACTGCTVKHHVIYKNANLALSPALGSRLDVLRAREFYESIVPACVLRFCLTKPTVLLIPVIQIRSTSFLYWVMKNSSAWRNGLQDWPSHKPQCPSLYVQKCLF